MTDEHTVSIVIPALNEARNLREVLPKLPPVHEVIVVDGRSVDDTVEASRQARPDVRVIVQTRRGKGNALAHGFEAATGDIIVMFDADGSADPAEIPAFVEALVAGADYAKGSRFASTADTAGSEDITLLRSAGNAGLNALANLLYGTRYSDLCYGYNAFWRRILPALDLPPAHAPALAADRLHWGDGFEIESILSCRVAAAKLRVTEVPSTELRRIHGETNLRTFADGWRVLRTLLAERFGRPRPAVAAPPVGQQVRAGLPGIEPVWSAGPPQPRRPAEPVRSGSARQGQR
jgi:glycosyltransferase involved in cell wall biosynthesis